ncbi:MAG: gamma-glutamylcyclotransferase [Propioniciclava sp.]
MKIHFKYKILLDRLAKPASFLVGLIVAVALIMAFPAPSQAAPDWSLKSKTDIGGGWGSYHTLSPGDMTGNGHDDLVTIDSKGLLWLYKSKRGGLFQSGRTKIGHGWKDMRLVDGADFNRDGLADIVAAAPNGYLFLYLNTGGANLARKVKIGHGWGKVRDLAAVDRAPNGYPGIYAIIGSQLWLYSTNGTGSITSSQVVGQGWSTIQSITNAGNIDSNKPDYLAALTAEAKINLYLFGGTTVPTYPVGHGFGGYQIVGGMTVSGTNHFRAIGPDGVLRSWRIHGKASTPDPAPPNRPTQSDSSTPRRVDRNDYPTRVFVYGSLREGGALASKLDGKYVAKGKTTLKGFKLFNYRGQAHAVLAHSLDYMKYDPILVGEVYWLKNDTAQQTLQSLDDVEKYDPNNPSTDQLYVRQKLQLKDGADAWVYIAGDTRGAKAQSGTRIFSGDWCDVEADLTGCG